MALILIVDDSPTEVHVMKKALEKSGYQTATAQDGAEGVRMAREMTPDLIRRWRGPHDFFWRIKIALLADVMERFPAPTIYLDSDTCLLRDPRPLLGPIRPGASACSNTRSPPAQSRCFHP